MHNRKKERREEGRDEGGGRAMGEGREEWEGKRKEGRNWKPVGPSRKTGAGVE